MTSDSTRRIHELLRQIGIAHGLEVNTKEPYYLPHNIRSRRADLEYRVVDNLGQSRPLVWFESDQTSRGAFTNTVKLFLHPLTFSQMPVSVVGILFGKADINPRSYEWYLPDLLFIPPRLISIFSVDSDDPRLAEVLARNVDELLDALCALREAKANQDVDSISLEYQNVLGSGALPVAACHLEGRVALAWLRYYRREIPSPCSCSPCVCPCTHAAAGRVAK